MEVCGVIHLTSVECAVMVCYKASDRPQANIYCLR